MAGGRKRKPIWDLYREIPASQAPKRCKKAACKYCGHETMAQVKRMHKHTQGCNKTPTNLKGSIADKPTCSTEKIVKQRLDPATQSNIASSTTGPMTKEDESRAHEHLVLAVISGNVPWDILSNEHFKRFCQALRPGFNLPSREQAARSALGCLDSKVSSAINKLVNSATALTIVTDTWTSSSGQNFSSWIIIDEMGSKELLAVEPSDPTKRSETIMQDVTLKVEMLKEMRRHGQMLLNFVSGSTSVNVKARRLLAQNSESGITLTGACLAHQSNLIVKDLMTIPQVWKIVEKVIVVASFVRRSLALRNSICRHLGRKKLPMWVPTVSKWHSFSVTLKHVINIHTAIQAVFVQDQPKPHMKTEDACAVKMLIDDEEFWKTTKALYELLKPYCVIAAISEMDNTSAGLILSGWMWLTLEISRTNFLSDDEKYTIIAKMRRRTLNFVEDHHLVSWFLDPRTRGFGLDTSGKRLIKDLARKLFRNLFPNKSEASENQLIEEWYAYDNQTGIFDKTSTSWLPYITSKPVLFWSDVDEYAPELSSLAKTVLSCASHAASCERLWSYAAATATKSRNCLSQGSIELLLRGKHHFTKGDLSSVRASDIFKKINDLETDIAFNNEGSYASDDIEESDVVNPSDLTQNLVTVFEGLPDEQDDLVPYDGVNIINHIDDAIYSKIASGQHVFTVIASLV